MPSSKSADRILKRIDQETARAEGMARRATHSAMVKIREYAVRSLTRRQVPNLKEFAKKQMLESLRDSMVLSDLLGRKRSALEVRQAGVSLSVYTEVLKVLSRQLDVDLDALQQQYETEALKVLNDQTDKVERELREAVNFTVRDGMSTQDATQYLKQKFDKMGLSPRNSYAVENIVRTQTQLAYNAGRWQADQDPAIQDILWGYRYVTVGDDRVREEHEALDGVVLPKDDAFWKRFWPPNGWSCRCQVIPIFSPRSVVRPASNVSPDPDFNFNPGMLFTAA